MKILQITLVKKWFDLTDSGEKSEEYREIKPYWIKRLVNPRMMIDENVPESKWAEFLINLDTRSFNWIKNSFLNVAARNGYSKTAPSWTRKCLGIEIREGRPEWGAEPGKKYFVIKLGKSLSSY